MPATRKTPTPSDIAKPRVFVDADVLFAGAVGPSQQGASLVILRMAEITLIEVITSEQAVTEAERNLAHKLPGALPAFCLLVSRCLKVVPDPQLSDLKPYHGAADAKDLPILVAAAHERCLWLVTFNVRHFQPGLADVAVLRPGEFILRVRDLLAHLNR
jgi:hypothetical protein